MFGVLAAGRLVDTDPVQVSETEFLFQVESPETVNHLVSALELIGRFGRLVVYVFVSLFVIRFACCPFTRTSITCSHAYQRHDFTDIRISVTIYRAPLGLLTCMRFGMNHTVIVYATKGCVYDWCRSLPGWHRSQHPLLMARYRCQLLFACTGAALV